MLEGDVMDGQNEIRKKYYDIIELQSKVNRFDKISNEKYLFLQKLNSYNIFYWIYGCRKNKHIFLFK